VSFFCPTLVRSLRLNIKQRNSLETATQEQGLKSKRKTKTAAKVPPLVGVGPDLQQDLCGWEKSD
jgi:hypothetical protein